MGNAKIVPALVLAVAMVSIATAAPVPAPETGASLDWIAGQWCGGDERARIDEVWLPEAGGALLGMSRTVRGAKTASFEFMRIAAEGARASLHAQPDGAPPTVFETVARGDGWIRFGNPEHDFPNVIEYRRDGDRLSAWIAGPGRDGKELRIPFEYRACAAGGS